MRVFVVGASGAIGRRLVPQFLERGHEVIGSARSPDKAERLRGLGAEPVVLDALDAQAVRAAVVAAEPDAIVHQAIALTASAACSRPHAKRVGKFVAQSNATNRYAREGGPVKSEDDPLDPNPVAAVRGRRFPVVGGGGVWSFIQLDDDAAATVLALEHDGPALYNIVDAEPSPTREWLPELARIVGAKPPQRFPRLLARLFAGEAPVVMATESRGAASAKAKRELGWTLRYPSWRHGFAELYGKPTAATSAPRAVPANTERVGSSWRSSAKPTPARREPLGRPRRAEQTREENGGINTLFGATAAPKSDRTGAHRTAESHAPNVSLDAGSHEADAAGRSVMDIFTSNALLG